MTTYACRNEKRGWSSVDSVVRGAIVDGFPSVSCPTRTTIAELEQVCEKKCVDRVNIGSENRRSDVLVNSLARRKKQVLTCMYNPFSEGFESP